jgi:acetyl-CoA synthetase
MATLQSVGRTQRCFSRVISQHSRLLCAVKDQKRFLSLNKQANSQLAFVSGDHNEIYKRSIEDPAKFWSELASNRLQWIRPFTEVMDCDVNVGKHRWFMDGLLNVSGSVIDV